MPRSKKKKTTILFLGANPTNSDRLDLEKEVSGISAELDKAQKRDQFVLQTRMAAQTRDIQSALLEFKPQIVHFAGHGIGQAGLVFEDVSGQTKLVSNVALAAIFKLAESFVECVVLNACYAEVQAEAIVQHINYAIGMKQTVRDDVSIAFAVGFYDGLGSSLAIEAAFEQGKQAIQTMLAGHNVGRKLSVALSDHSPAPLPDYLIPVLKRKQN